MNEKIDSRKDRSIKLPAKFILTEKGDSFFSSRKIPLFQLMTTEGVKKPGFFSKDFNAESIQKMIIKSLVGETLIERPEFLTKRREIIDTTKLIIYAIIYKVIKEEIEDLIYGQKIYDRWNNAHPENKILKGQKPDAKIIENYCSQNKDAIEKLKNVIVENTSNIIDLDKNMQPAIKIEKKRSLKKFVDQIENDCWYIFSNILTADEQGLLLPGISKILHSFVKKTQIADYFALMLMELIQNSEKAHFEVLSEQNNLSTKEEFDTFIKVPENRNKLIQISLKNKDLLFLSWKIQETQGSTKYKCKLQLILSNRGMVKEKIKKEMREKININTGSKNLADFYSEKSSSGISLGAGLGLFYLSFIEKECENESILFEATVNTDLKTEETLVYLMLFF